MKGEKNNRKLFRINLPLEMCGQITFLKVNGNEVKTGKTNICINNISAGGLSFSSKLSFPQKNVIYKVFFKINNILYSYEAEIRWINENTNGTFKYGLMFNLNEFEKEKLIPVMTGLSLNCKRTTTYCYESCNKKKCPNRKRA